MVRALVATKGGIENFSEENVINFFNNFNDNSANNSVLFASHCTFISLEKFIVAVEKNKKLFKILLKTEEEKAS